MARHVPRERRPDRPAELDPDASLVDLLERYHRYVLRLAAARADPSRASSADVGDWAVAALAIGHAVVQDLFEERWPIVHDALLHGVSPEQVGVAAGGLERDELMAGLTAWGARHATADAGQLAVLALVDARADRAG